MGILFKKTALEDVKNVTIKKCKRSKIHICQLIKTEERTMNKPHTDKTHPCK